MLVVHVVAAVSWVLGVGLVLAIAAAALRRWHLAIRVSRGVALGAAATFGALLLFMAISMVEPGVFLGLLPDSTDPSQKARVLAELIAGFMNCGALSILVGVVAVPIWLFSQRQGRQANG